MKFLCVIYAHMCVNGNTALGLGPGPLELEKLATKLEFWETI